jgi:hypothetical protein
MLESNALFSQILGKFEILCPTVDVQELMTHKWLSTFLAPLKFDSPPI